MKLQHITINTACLEESVSFYQEVIGLKVQGSFTNPMGAKIVFLSNGEGEPAIELIEDKEQVYRGTGISIGFHTDDVEETHKKTEAAGLEPTPIVSPNPNAKFFFVKDPNGVTIQLI